MRRNFIHDFRKASGDEVSYAAFLKGNSREGLFEGNVVSCVHSAGDTGGYRVGLSFGGGGRAPIRCARTAAARPSTRTAS